jgi:hypothetical protein
VTQEGDVPDGSDAHSDEVGLSARLRVEQIVKHTFDRPGREVLQFGISEMPNGTLAHLVGAFPRFSACIDALHILQATGWKTR